MYLFCHAPCLLPLVTQTKRNWCGRWGECNKVNWPPYRDAEALVCIRSESMLGVNFTTPNLRQPTTQTKKTRVGDDGKRLSPLHIFLLFNFFCFIFSKPSGNLCGGERELISFLKELFISFQMLQTPTDQLKFTIKSSNCLVQSSSS